MKGHRMFYLTNSINQKLSLNENDLFGHTPEGLGLSFTNNYIPYNGNFIPISQEVNQGSLSLMVLYGAITKHSYIKFYKFMDFLNYQPYTLEYETEAGTFNRVCQMNEVTKTEIKLYGVLNESMVIDYLTPWYKIIDNSIGGDGTADVAGDGKIYIQTDTEPGYYSYDYIYEGFGFLGNDTYSSIINNSRTFNITTSSPIRIVITATDSAVVNPSWDLYVRSELVQSDRYFVTIPPGHSLVVSSFPENQLAQLVDQNGVGSPIYQLQDLTKTNFITIPPGNSTLVFNVGTAQIRWSMREEYLIV